MSIFTKVAYQEKLKDISIELKRRLNEQILPGRPPIANTDHDEYEYDPRSAAITGDEYITHKSMAEQVDPATRKAAEVEDIITPKPEEVPTTPPATVPGMDPAMAAGMPTDTAAMGGMGMRMGIDPMSGMAAPQDIDRTATQVGRIYELKKIHARLVSLDSHLSQTSDVILLRLREFVGKALDLFHTMVSNIDAFIKEGKLDDIIVFYYEFIETVYEILNKYYDIISSDQESN